MTYRQNEDNDKPNKDNNKINDHTDLAIESNTPQQLLSQKKIDQNNLEEKRRGSIASTVTASDDSPSNCSSTSTSDAEDEDTDINSLPARGWLPEDKSTITTPAAISHQMNGVSLPNIEPPNFGRVHVENSTNVHLGNRTFYKGPVTIRQVVYANSTSVIENKNGVDCELGKNGGNGSTIGNNCGSEFADSTNPLNASLAPAEKRVLELCWKHRSIVVITTTAVILALLTIVGILLTSTMTGTNQTKQPIIPASPNDSSINNEPTISGVRVIKRVEWGAQPPVKPAKPLTINPPPYVIISHTATTFCYTQAQCVLNVRVAQTFHIESRGWDDIGYNFLVGGDGLVYEGRGWDVEGAHTYEYNRRSIGISFIGTFNSEKPTPAQLYAAQRIIEFGVENGKIDKNYKLLGHRQCIKTESPGEVLYNIIKTWDHWSPTP